jgi:hypothetical protein
MSLLDRVEARFGKYAVPGLMRFVVGMSIAVFVLYKLWPHTINFWLLIPELVMQGEVWRLVSYIFIPQFGGLFGDYLSLFFYVLFQVWVGDGLEKEWGPFRLNVYFVLGMIGTTLAAFFFGATFSNGMLINSLFFAFARFYGDMVIHLFFVLPMKVKWLAWIDAVFLVFTMIIGDMEARMTILLGMVNYFVFFGKDIVREARMRREIGARRARFDTAIRSDVGETLHRCKTCGCTEESEPEREFRVAGDGEEYCTEHLPNRRQG